MNFKITKGKAIGSIIILLIIWILIFTIGPLYNNPHPFVRSFLEIHNRVNILSNGNISLFIIELVIAYLIWSLFQKQQ